MASLPIGWESDYDGQRWFYKFTASGQIQYHFPTAGDEFPEYVDSSAPAPALAPEERLESQQQMRRHSAIGITLTTPSSTTPSYTISPDDGRPRPRRAVMSATARPISAVWEGDGSDDDQQVFQPENFMYLGPGTYSDVSPLVEEEEEAARRIVAGEILEHPSDNGQNVSADGSKRASPATSAGTTPKMQKDETKDSPPVESVPVSPERAIHKIDGGGTLHELPVPHPQVFDPVGNVAEMPTEITAVARVELHPDPIEMADSSVLAPIEAPVPVASSEQPAAGLPEKFGPAGLRVPQKVRSKDAIGDKKEKIPAERGEPSSNECPAFQPDMPGMGARSRFEQPAQGTMQNGIESSQLPTPGESSQKTSNQGGQETERQQPPVDQEQERHRQSLYIWSPNQLPQRAHSTSQPRTETAKEFKIARKPAGSSGLQKNYLPYVPGKIDVEESSWSTSERRRTIGSSLQREVSLMMASGTSANLDPSTVPCVLAPPRKPSADTTAQPAGPRKAASLPIPGTVATQASAFEQETKQDTTSGFGHPSQPLSQQAVPVPGSSAVTLEQVGLLESKVQNIVPEIPSVLMPAHGQERPPLSREPSPAAPVSDSIGSSVARRRADSDSMSTAAHKTSVLPRQGQQPPYPEEPFYTPPPAQLRSQSYPSAGSHGYPPYRAAPTQGLPSQGPSREGPREFWQKQRPLPAPSVHANDAAYSRLSQPARPHSLVGFPSPQRSSSDDQPPAVPEKDRSTAAKPSPSPVRGGYQVATVAIGMMPSVLPRAESQPSSFPLQTPSPLEKFRRASLNPALMQGYGEMVFTPSPITSTPGSGPRASTQGPLVPSKLPHPHPPGSYFPVQDASPGAAGRPQAPRIESAPKKGRKATSPGLLDGEHPIGYQVSPDGSRLPPAKTKSGSPRITTDRLPATLAEKSACSPPAHLLGRIEEHDESQIGAGHQKVEANDSRSSSTASGSQHSSSSCRSMQRPSLQQIQATTALQTQGPWQQEPGQRHLQRPATGPPPRGLVLPRSQVTEGQMSPPVYQTSPHGQISPHSQAPPQGHTITGHYPQQQVPSTVLMDAKIAPQAVHQSAAHVSQPGFTSPLGKEKEKKWAKWFQSTKLAPSTASPEQLAQQPRGPQGWHPSQGSPAASDRPRMHPQRASGPPTGIPTPLGIAQAGHEAVMGQGRHSISGPVSTSTPTSTVAPSGTTAPGQIQLRSPVEQELRPRPLFSQQASGRPGYKEQNAGGHMAAQAPPDSRWAKLRSTADYSGGGWGNEGDWQKREGSV
ncbi:hypothetical protein RJ55_00959 [Drechmeria coniospora]|nr:hypothetical protein RJ55_00959 [Drechmeria coniospora]